MPTVFLPVNLFIANNNLLNVNFISSISPSLSGYALEPLHSIFLYPNWIKMMSYEIEANHGKPWKELLINDLIFIWVLYMLITQGFKL